MLSSYLCALDIGGSKVAACVARTRRKQVVDIFFASAPAKGIKKGVVVNSLDLVGCISRLLKDLKVESGLNIKLVSVNISGADIVTKHSRAIIPLAERGNKVITLSDIRKVDEQARILGSDLEEEIIHQIPFAYSIDSQQNILNPLGLYGHRLETDLYLISVKLSTLQTFSRLIHQAGYEITDLFFSGLATSKAVFNKEMKAGINIFCDIGSDITELLIFKDGGLTDIQILAFGGDDLTAALSDSLKIPFDLAEDIKRSNGIIGDDNLIAPDKEILVKKGDLYKPIKQKLVCEIVTTKAKLIASAIKEALDKKLDCNQVNNFVVCGRTILTAGFMEALESALGLSVKLSRITQNEIASLVNRDNNLSGQKYLTYLTSLGMLSAAIEGNSAKTLPISQPARQNFILKAIDRFKEVYQEYF